MSYPEEGRKSSPLKIVLIILGIVAGVSVLACGGCMIAGVLFLRGRISEDPQKARELASSIAEFDLPAGYDKAVSADLYISKWVMFTRSDDPGELIMFMSFPQTGQLDKQAMRQQMQQAQRQQNANKQLQELETETRKYVIRGEESDVELTKSRSDDGKEFRQVIAFFESKPGNPAVVLITMPEAKWQNGGEAQVETFLKSLK